MEAKPGSSSIMRQENLPSVSGESLGLHVIIAVSLSDGMILSRRDRWVLRAICWLSLLVREQEMVNRREHFIEGEWFAQQQKDRKSTRLNSSHANISYAVFC